MVTDVLLPRLLIICRICQLEILIICHILLTWNSYHLSRLANLKFPSHIQPLPISWKPSLSLFQQLLTISLIESVSLAKLNVGILSHMGVTLPSATSYNQWQLATLSFRNQSFGCFVNSSSKQLLNTILIQLLSPLDSKPWGFLKSIRNTPLWVESELIDGLHPPNLGFSCHFSLHPPLKHVISKLLHTVTSD